MKYKGDFKKFSRDQLAGIFADPEYGPLYQQIAVQERGFAEVSADLFSMEYLASKLALSARVWEESCIDARLESGTAKHFFQAAMDCFQTPKMTPLASSFSEAYYAVEDKPLQELAPLLAAHLFQKLRPRSPGSDSKGREQALRTSIESLESFRNAFENRFEEFLLNNLEF